jgi:hypothetical protein
MHSSTRSVRRTGWAALAALGLVLFSAPATHAEEEEGTKNLSTPVILVDDDAMSAAFNETTVPDPPTGNADYTQEGVDYYTSVGSDTYTSTIDQNFDADTWGADWAAELEDPVVADVKWGDNLVSHSFSGQMKQPIRVEVNLFANEATTSTLPEMLGYEMTSLEGTHENELFGTEGEAVALTPMVYTPNATLTILEYDAATDWYSTVVLPPTPMTGEVNGSGKLIYGFNWGTPSGLQQPGVGNYRLIFTVADESLVTFGKVLLGDDTEPPLHMPYLYGDKVSYLDIGIGTTPLDPPLPFEEAMQKTDFNGDGNADLLARNNNNGYLYLYPGNGASGFLPRITIGSGWNGMTAILAPGDFNGDGNADILARDTLGRMWLYRGTGDVHFLPRVQVGYGWNGMTALITPEDFNGDGNVDLLARATTGVLYLYPGNGTGYWLPRVQVGTGWNGMTSIFGPGDFSGDGAVDVLARATTGVLYLYPGNGTGGWLPRVQVGTGWNSLNPLVGPGDFSGDRNVDVIGRNAYGQLLLYRGNGSSGWLMPPSLIGYGWSSYFIVS